MNIKITGVVYYGGQSLRGQVLEVDASRPTGYLLDSNGCLRDIQHPVKMWNGDRILVSVKDCEVAKD